MPVQAAVHQCAHNTNMNRKSIVFALHCVKVDLSHVFPLKIFEISNAPVDALLTIVCSMTSSRIGNGLNDTVAIQCISPTRLITYQVIPMPLLSFDTFYKQ